MLDEQVSVHVSSDPGPPGKPGTAREVMTSLACDADAVFTGHVSTTEVLPTEDGTMLFTDYTVTVARLYMHPGRPFPRNPATMKTMLKTLRFKAVCFVANGRLDLRAITAIMIHCNRTDERAVAFDDLQIVPA